MHKLIRSSQQQASLKPLERILLNEAHFRCVYLRRKHRPLQGGIGQTGGESLGVGGFAGVVQFVHWWFGNGRGRRKARGRRGSNKINAKRHGMNKKLSLEVVHQFMTEGNERDTKRRLFQYPLIHSSHLTESQAPVINRAHHVRLQAKHCFDHGPRGTNQMHVQCHRASDAGALYFYRHFYCFRAGATASAAALDVVSGRGRGEGNGWAQFGLVNLP